MIRIVGKRLRIGNHNIYFVEFAGVLKLHATLQGPYVMSDMKPSGRPVSGQNNLLHKNLRPKENQSISVYFFAPEKSTKNRKKDRKKDLVRRLLRAGSSARYSIAIAVSKASSIIAVKEVCRSSAVVASPVTRLSEIVQMASALLPARAAFM